MRWCKKWTSSNPLEYCGSNDKILSHEKNWAMQREGQRQREKVREKVRRREKVAVRGGEKIEWWERILEKQRRIWQRNWNIETFYTVMAFLSLFFNPFSTTPNRPMAYFRLIWRRFIRANDMFPHFSPHLMNETVE